MTAIDNFVIAPQCEVEGCQRRCWEVKFFGHKVICFYHSRQRDTWQRLFRTGKKKLWHHPILERDGKLMENPRYDWREAHEWEASEKNKARRLRDAESEVPGVCNHGSEQVGTEGEPTGKSRQRDSDSGETSQGLSARKESGS